MEWFCCWIICNLQLLHHHIIFKLCIHYLFYYCKRFQIFRYSVAFRIIYSLEIYNYLVYLRYWRPHDLAFSELLFPSKQQTEQLSSASGKPHHYPSMRNAACYQRVFYCCGTIYESDSDLHNDILDLVLFPPPHPSWLFCHNSWVKELLLNYFHGNSIIKIVQNGVELTL